MNLYRSTLPQDNTLTIVTENDAVMVWRDDKGLHIGQVNIPIMEAAIAGGFLTLADSDDEIIDLDI